MYTISADIKTQNTIPPRARAGARVRLLQVAQQKWAFTKAVSGTTDWATSEKAHVQVVDGSVGVFRAEALGEVTGTSWFKNFFVRRENPPALDTFLLYPNYRGMMFSDQSQVARVAIEVNPPENTTMAQLHVGLELTDRGRQRCSRRKRLSPPADGSTVATVDMTSLPLGKYRVQGYLEGPGNKRIFTQSSYTIVKVGSATHDTMKAWIDREQYYSHGRQAQRFVIGMYDTTGFANRARLLRAAIEGDSQGADQHDDQLLSLQRPRRGDLSLHRGDGAVGDLLPGERERVFSGDEARIRGGRASAASAPTR